MLNATFLPITIVHEYHCAVDNYTEWNVYLAKLAEQAERYDGKSLEDSANDT